MSSQTGRIALLDNSRPLAMVVRALCTCACCHRGLSITEQISSHVTGPTRRIPQISCSRLDETQMWNVSAQLDLRQLRPRRPSVPRKPQYSRDNINHATLGPSQPSAPGRLGRKPQAQFFFFFFAVYFLKSAPAGG